MKQNLYHCSKRFYVHALDFQRTFWIEKDDVILFTGDSDAVNSLWKVALTKFGLVLAYSPNVLQSLA